MTDLSRLRLAGDWFENNFGPKAKGRSPTWKVALGLYLERGGGVIVETGCQREEEDWDAGCSTLIFGKFLKHFSVGHLYTVDISQENVELAKRVARKAGVDDAISFDAGDSVGFLERFGQPIDFLYLDSWDWLPEEPMLTLCQGHQLREIMACINQLSPKAIVLLDDNSLPAGGKTRLSKQFLETVGWKCLMDLQQSLWVRSQSL